MPDAARDELVIPGRPPSRGVRALITVVSAGIAVSAAAALAWSIATTPLPFLIGFEVVTVVAGVVGVLLGRGKFWDGPALALVCISGAVGVGSLLGYLSAGPSMQPVLKPLMLGRAGAAALLLIIAAWIVLSRDAGRSVRALMTGAAFGAAFLAVAAGCWMFRTTLTNLPAMAGIVVGGLLAVVALGLVSAATHYCIRAFQLGTPGVLDEGPETGAL